VTLSCGGNKLPNTDAVIFYPGITWNDKIIFGYQRP
jgi:hypothetical protein